MSRHGLLLTLVMMLLAAGCNLSTRPPEPTSTPLPPQLDLTCDQVVGTALQAVGPACNDTGRNQACYGNNLVNAQFREGIQAVFDKVGDLVGIQGIRLLSTSPLNQAYGTWGVTLLKAQANLPDALPGQNVTFLLYGGATIDNVTPSVNAVVLNTGVTGTTCAEAPESAVLMQSPNGTQVAMNINGADVELGSTVHVMAQANGNLTFSTISGAAVVSAFGTTQTVIPGSRVTVPLGSTNGLQVIGPPSDPQPFDLNLIQRAPLSLLPDAVQIPAPIVPGPSATPTLPGLPITPTLPPVFIPLPPTAIPPVCVPRADWVFTYIVQPGDTLFAIARRFGISATELQIGNCIPNANVLIVGQTLRVPTPPPAPTNTPAPTAQPGLPTSTTIPFATSTPFEPIFYADTLSVPYYEPCTMVHWEVHDVSGVQFENQDVPFIGSQQVCPDYPEATYTLLVIFASGERRAYTLTIDARSLG